MKRFYPCMTGTGPDRNVASFCWLPGTQQQTWNTVEGTRLHPISVPVAVRRLYVQVQTAPGAGNYWDFTVRRNGATNSLLTVRIADTATSASDDTHAAFFNDGDLVGIMARPSTLDDAAKVPADAGRVRWRTELETPYGFLVFSGTNELHTGAAAGNPAFLVIGGGFNWEDKAASGDPDGLAQVPVPIPGRMRRLRVRASSVADAGASFAVAPFKNGSASALTCTINETTSLATDYAHIVTVAAGDTVSVGATPSGVTTGLGMSTCFEFIPDTDGQSFLTYASSVLPSTAAARYEQLLGRGGVSWTATEADRQAPSVTANTLTGIYAKLLTAPGAAASGKKWTFAVRKGAASTAVTVDILETALTNHATGLSVSLADNDLIDLACTPTGTPAAMTGGAHIGVALSGPVTPAAPGLPPGLF